MSRLRALLGRLGSRKGSLTAHHHNPLTYWLSPNLTHRRRLSSVQPGGRGRLGGLSWWACWWWCWSGPRLTSHSADGAMVQSLLWPGLLCSGSKDGLLASCVATLCRHYETPDSEGARHTNNNNPGQQSNISIKHSNGQNSILCTKLNINHFVELQNIIFLQ